MDLGGDGKRPLVLRNISKANASLADSVEAEAAMEAIADCKGEGNPGGVDVG